MRRVVLDVEYHRGRFHGWQRQGENRSVQATLERAVADLVRHPVTVNGAGRTDRGVHALAMPCHVDIDSRLAPRELLLALNARLPDDCALRRVRLCDPRFHARFDALAKTYRYSIFVSQSRRPLFADRAHVQHRPLDVAAMARAAALLEGRHDFAAFQSQGEDQQPDDGPEFTPDLFGPASLATGLRVAPPWRKPRPRGTVRELFSLRVTRRASLVQITARGDGFLRGMVRALAGTLQEVGLGRREPGWVRELLADPRRPLAGANLPAHGLALVKVDYPADPFEGYASHAA